MTVKRFSGSFKTRTDILDNITPNNVVQPNVSVPAGEWKPANWLPVIWQGEASQDNFVISSGKVVCMTKQGEIVPARYRFIAMTPGAAATDVVITYSALDVAQGTIDIETGVAVTAAKTVTFLEMAVAVLARGLVSEHDAGFSNTDPFTTTDSAEIADVLQAYVSAPVGVAAYDVYAWAGDAPGALNFANYQKQHLVQFFTDVQMQVPVHVSHTDPTNNFTGNAAETITAAQASYVAWNPATGGHGSQFPCPNAMATPVGLLLTATQLNSLTRYSADVAVGDNLVGIALPHAPVASNTTRTPMGDGSAALVRQKSSIAKVTQDGDWYLDPDVGVIIAFETDGDAPALAFTANITYSAYVSTATNSCAASERYVHFSGNPRPGTHVTYDRYSNFIACESTNNEIIGRCLGTIRQPKGLLDRTRTAWEGSSFDKTAQMPGTATAGYTDLITLTDEVASDLVALINVKA